MTEPHSQDHARSRSAGAALRGLYSVVQIQHLLRTEFARAQRYAYPLSCLVLAVDQLDALRDRHGYEFKEHVIDELIDQLKRVTRSSDFLGRSADDRLIVLLPHTTRAGARQLCARLIENTGALAFELAGESARVSISIGLSSSEGETALFHDALFQSAEAAWNEATAAGGGRFLERPLAGQG